MNTNLAIYFLALCLLIPCSADDRPNILFILADDLNADWKSDRLSYMPNLKKYLAEEGTEFVNHVAAVPVCREGSSPSPGPRESRVMIVRHWNRW